MTPSDLEFIGAHRTNSNRLGIAVQLCFLRHPGRAWTPEERIPATMLRWIAAQVNADPGDIESYAERDPTRREDFLELLQEYSWQNFGLQQYRQMSAWLMNQARSTDLGMALITLLISELQHLDDGGHSMMLWTFAKVSHKFANLITGNCSVENGKIAEGECWFSRMMVRQTDRFTPPRGYSLPAISTRIGPAHRPIRIHHSEQLVSAHECGDGARLFCRNCPPWRLVGLR